MDSHADFQGAAAASGFPGGLRRVLHPEVAAGAWAGLPVAVVQPRQAPHRLARGVSGVAVAAVLASSRPLAPSVFCSAVANPFTRQVGEPKQLATIYTKTTADQHYRCQRDQHHHHHRHRCHHGPY